MVIIWRQQTRGGTFIHAAMRGPYWLGGMISGLMFVVIIMPGPAGSPFSCSSGFRATPRGDGSLLM